MLLEVLAIITFLVLLWLNRPQPVAPPKYAVPTFTSTPLASLLPGVTYSVESDSRPAEIDSVRPAFFGSLPVVHETDYVVVGGGPGGLAAARTLCERGGSDSSSSSPTVTLLESGEDMWRSQRGTVGAIWEHLTHKANLLQFAPDLVGTSYDHQLTILRPLVSRDSKITSESDTVAADTPEKKAAKAHEDAERKTVYPRGRGLGGTSILDWGLLFSDSAAGDDDLLAGPQGEVPQFRSPLSWAFGESSAAALGTKEADTKGSTSHPQLLRTDRDGTRLALPSYVLDPSIQFSHYRSTDVPSRKMSAVKIVSHCEVVAILSKERKNGDDGNMDTLLNATHVVCRIQSPGQSGAKLCLVAVKKSVIVAAGVIASPKILISSALPQLSVGDASAQTTPTVRTTDVIGLPMVFQAHQGISDDGVNVRCVSATLSWILKRRGPLLNPIGDTLCRKAVDGVDGAEVVLFMVPSGGRDVERYHTKGMNRALGRFSEAFTIYILVVGVEGVGFSDAEIMSPGKPANPSASGDLSAETVSKLEKCFLFGMRLCYKIVGTAPLSKLTTEREAVDTLLLARCEGGDASVALKVARALSTPISKLTAAQREEANRMLAWAYEAARKEDYMIQYIHAHSQWMGFGSGSCVDMLDDPDASGRRFRVAGTRNVFVGDCSAVPASVCKNSLYAGSVSSALNCGVLAALRALQT